MNYEQFPVNKTEDEETIERLRAELSEADRRAGEAQRRLEFSQDSSQKRESWLRKAKAQWGVDCNVSFDVVWEEALKMRAELAATQKLLNIYKGAITPIDGEGDAEDQLANCRVELTTAKREIQVLRNAAVAAEELKAAQSEPVAYIDANYGVMRCGNALDDYPIGTKLYVAPQPADAETLRDAERYRWLRDNDACILECVIEKRGFRSTMTDARRETWTEREGWAVSTLPMEAGPYPTMDAAIDAAMKGGA
jgi:hypothetical protein